MDPRIDQLQELTTLFESNYAQYKSLQYDEANTRVDFIDPFFALLDWDIANKQGFSERYREVVREDKVVIEGKIKAPDCSFRIGGVYVITGTFIMNNGSISENTGSVGTWGGGGGVYVESGRFTMNGGTISGNTAYNEGGNARG
jgi:hypothetical protein